MMILKKPTTRPSDPRFSCGPCRKPSGWSAEALGDALLGRSHRSPAAVARLRAVCERTHRLLDLPEGYRVGITPGSNTGAFEMAMWSLLGARPVSVLAWENFGNDWLKDAVDELGIAPTVHKAPYGELPDLTAVNFDDDVCFTWNGTSSGVCMPNGEAIPKERKGLTICDATSALFGMEIDFSKLDVITFSWQKILGGEAGHGMIILGPRALERLEGWHPTWPVPKILRLSEGGKLKEAFFEGRTINTPSLLCVQDYLFSLDWVASIGGLEGAIARTKTNADALDSFVQEADFLEYLAKDASVRSPTSVCLRFSDPEIADDADFIKAVCAKLEKEGVAYDIANYPSAPLGLRIWCGTTVEREDIVALTLWLKWAYWSERAKYRSA